MIYAIKFKILIYNILFPLLFDYVGNILADIKDVYHTLILPRFSLDFIPYSLVWFSVAILFGISAYLIYTSKESSIHKRLSFAFYYTELLLICIWKLCFYRLNFYFFSMLIIIVVIIFSIIIYLKFSKNNKTSGILILPVIAWMFYIFFFNYFVYLLN